MPSAALNPLRGILFKVISVVIFVMMQTCIKSAGPDIPAGQITFYRSLFALVPIVGYLVFLGQLRRSFYTASLWGHFKRGFFGIVSMVAGFYGLVHLPMPDAIAIGYSSPLIAVALAALILKETVRVYRWTAVGIGMVGVVIICWPKLTMFEAGGMGTEQALGAAAVIVGAFLGGLAMIQTRQLVRTEKTTTIVLYFSLTAAGFSLVSLPFGWIALTGSQTFYLIASGFCGGVAQIFLTESYRQADVSTVAPFEYTSILLAMAIGYGLFGDIPTTAMLIGTAITISAGLFIIFREHQLGLERKAARKASPPLSGG